MNKSFYLFFVLSLVSVLSFTSCKETEEEDEYRDWQARNESYLSFVAEEAKANQGNEVGEWKVIESYKLNGPASGINDYVYARINKVGTGTTSPIYTDSIACYYRGTMIDGTLFDKSIGFTPDNALSADTIFPNKPNDFYGDVFKHVVYYPDLELLTATQKPLYKFIDGWVIALQEMKTGDYWTLYVPSALAYGESGYSSIPAQSMLIFDLYLGKVYTK